LSKWEEVNSECLEANILAVKDDDDPVEDFVNACEHVNPEFHQYWINRLEDRDVASGINYLAYYLRSLRHFGHSGDECQKGS